MCLVSDWYPSLGNYSFPTVFVRLRRSEIDALLNKDLNGAVARGVQARLEAVIARLPGSSFVHADACAPNDAPSFLENSGAVSSGRAAWILLTESAKVHAAFAAGRTEHLGLHPYRRLERVREFRLFIHGHKLRGMSQMLLERHFARLAGRKEEIWSRGLALTSEIADFLPHPDIVVDVYLTSTSELLIIDLNDFGPPTEPLLFRTWEQNWDADLGLRLIPPPVQLGGEIAVTP